MRKLLLKPMLLSTFNAVEAKEVDRRTKDIDGKEVEGE